MNIWVIIPVKQLSKTKSRLASVLSSEDRANLTLKLLKRLFSVVGDVEEIEKVLVVSRDETVVRLTTELNHIALSEPAGADLNESIQFAFSHAQISGASYVLILPSDLPLITSADLEMLLSQVVDDGLMETAVICPDAIQMGTNALLLPIGKPFQFRYGVGSFEQHLEEAIQNGLDMLPVVIPNIQFDLDTEEDWEQYQRKFGKPY